MKRVFYFLLVFSCSMIVTGHPRCFPQCSNTGYTCYEGQLQFKKLYGRSGYQQNLYIVNNISGRTVHLNHPQQHRALSAGWHSTISPHHVSALALDKSRFDMICSVKRRLSWRNEDKYQCVPCQSVLRICRVPSAKLAIGTEGTYWLAENYATERKLAKRLVLSGVSW